jgi:outer membrane murein-binding lipoprotein Lpp
MKKSVALLMFGLLLTTVVLSSCGNRKKANCEAYRAHDLTIEQESDLASR